MNNAQRGDGLYINVNRYLFICINILQSKWWMNCINILRRKWKINNYTARVTNELQIYSSKIIQSGWYVNCTFMNITLRQWWWTLFMHIAQS
jgi:hypothetical protein